MSLYILDYLSSKEGGRKFAEILTVLMKKILADQEPVAEDDSLEVIQESIKELYPDMDPVEYAILAKAFQEYLEGQEIATNLVQAAFATARGVCKEYVFVKLLSGILYLAANLNNSIANMPSQREHAVSKRDFIRLTNMMFDMNMLTIRNGMIFREESPSKFH